ncbi:MAG: VCBS repeat-containing protein [Planctomycetes bacterium]|nr:VCBS repeat-containing protein [Planctomycetota bacterium]
MMTTRAALPIWLLLPLLLAGSAACTDRLLAGERVRFPARRAFAIGSRQDFSPTAVRVVDLDGDGRPEIVAAGAAQQELSILIPQGRREFSVPCNQPLGLPVGVDLLAVDMDGDQDEDLVLLLERAGGGEDGGNVALLRNDGRGRLDLWGLIDVPGVPIRAALADFDLDGTPDIAIAGGSGAGISLLASGGDAAFSRRHQVSFRLPIGDLAVADLDGDGLDDLAVAAAAYTPEAGAFVFPSLSAGEFGAPRKTECGQSPRSIDAGDIDGDGDLDLVVAMEGEPGIHLLFNDGRGLFPRREILLDVYSPCPVRLADLSGDGHLDLVGRGGRVVCLGRGDGEFEETLSFGAGGTGTVFDLGDLDGDGALDAVVAGRRVDAWDDVSVLYGLGDGRLEGALVLENPGSSWLWNPVAIAAGDFDGDGDIDLAAAQLKRRWIAEEIVVRENTEPRRFGPARRIAVEPSVGLLWLRDLVSADFDRDGADDLAACGAGGAVVVMISDGRGGFPEARITPWSDSGGPIRMAAADLDRDGDTDLAAVSASPPLLTFLPNPGDGGFESRAELRLEGGPCLALAAGGFDAGAEVALAILQAPAEVSLVRIRPPRDEAARPVLALRGESATAIAAGDMDGDGVCDLVVALEGRCCPRADGSLAIAFGDGAGRFDRVHRMGVQRRFPLPRIEDVDRDGLPDVLLGDGGDGGPDTILWLRNTGEGLLGESVALPFEGHPIPPAAVDLDGDGAADLASASNRSGDIAILFGESVSWQQGDHLALFRRGDVDSSGAVDPADALALLIHLFLGAGRPACRDAADAGDDGRLAIDDAITILRFFFRRGPPLPPPGPECGSDGTADALDCAGYAACCDNPPRAGQGEAVIGPILERRDRETRPDR